ncbi:MAG: pseudouridine synthase [Eubacteriales bacterium]
MEKIRLQKYISECGIMSRRAAEEEIRSGNVTINGEKANLGDKVDPENDEVYIGKRKISGEGENRRFTYIMLNKPAGYVTTLSDEKGRKTIAELISDVGVRLYPIGRLDLYSEGLLLCTNDGELTNKITHPSHRIPKCYMATITSRLSAEDVAELSVPFELDGYMLQPLATELIGYTKSGEAESTIVKFTLYEGRNREIRKICAHHGLKLSKLKRISVGELTLVGLRSGKWRHLSEDEVNYLKNL